MTDADLYARSNTASNSGRAQPPERIVRKAEDTFVAAGGGPTSLADLCSAAGISKNALYPAFHAVCRQPPLEYFRKWRRLYGALGR